MKSIKVINYLFQFPEITEIYIQDNSFLDSPKLTLLQAIEIISGFYLSDEETIDGVSIMTI